MRVLLTGGTGLLGSAIAHELARPASGHDVTAPTIEQLDLRDQAGVTALLEAVRPDAIIHTAAAVGGIDARRQHPMGYLLNNLTIDSAVIGGAVRQGVSRLIYISSAAIYPAAAPQPIGETALMGGPLAPDSESYALAKIAGSRLCALASEEYGFAYRALAPANMYGPGDDYTPGRAHLIASAIDKIATATRDGLPDVDVWGDGTARREFLYAPDLAGWIAASLDRLEDWPPLMNVGVGEDHSVGDYY
ncbi:MAG: NAD-dependent epimerase/dehydratase family protein, partial [Bifidobacteriaceae bacterium]|nr:NAD-dependent epimerase/dehydratase family protein [Bifidobacteriaceae bacterium]